ncbi:MAG TPA: twin-arginine translocase subunit TatC [Planctomycetota bacterium]|nr:twin-arginine translocase subunit TatC [Planctomycetota bacterium]
MSLDLQKRVEGAQEPEVRMSFGEHIEELRSRLLKSIVVVLLAIVGCMFMYQPLVHFISRPHFRAMAMLKIPLEQSRFLSDTYTGPVVAMMKLTFIIAFFVSSPWVGYQIWAFISAGLYKHERKYVLAFAPVSFALFVIGCVFGYLVLVPLSLYGLANMLDTNIVSPTYSFSEYLGLVMKLTILLGAVFQLPLLMVFFAKIGLVQPSSYNKWRRAAIIANVIFAAIVTPADVLTMLLVMVPLLLLYEIGVVASYLLCRAPAKPAAPA